MLTGAFSAGARSAGQEAIAEASEAQDARDRPLLGQREGWVRHHVLGVFEDGAWVQERLKIEDVVSVAVVGRMVPRSKTSGAAARPNGPRRRDTVLAQAALDFDLVDIARRRAVDGDSPRLHGFGDLPDQFDLEQPVVEGRVLDLDVVGQVELPLRHWSVV